MTEIRDTEKVNENENEKKARNKNPLPDQVR